jgi:hypothetical protein
LARSSYPDFERLQEIVISYFAFRGGDGSVLKFTPWEVSDALQLSDRDRHRLAHLLRKMNESGRRWPFAKFKVIPSRGTGVTHRVFTVQLIKS